MTNIAPKPEKTCPTNSRMPRKQIFLHILQRKLTGPLVPKPNYIFLPHYVNKHHEHPALFPAAVMKHKANTTTHLPLATSKNEHSSNSQHTTIIVASHLNKSIKLPQSCQTKQYRPSPTTKEEVFRRKRE